jgi:hypothetical protein
MWTQGELLSHRLGTVIAQHVVRNKNIPSDWFGCLIQPEGSIASAPFNPVCSKFNTDNTVVVLCREGLK